MAVQLITFNSRGEWLEHRRHYIGGSDASAIIGVNGWKNNVQLWEEKTGKITPEDISDKDCVIFGVKAEPILRELFKITYPKYEMLYEENNSFVNDKYPFAAASLDGELIEKETGRHGIWECKTTEIVSSMQREKWAGQIPNNYFAQLIHYLMVRDDCDFAHLTALLTFKFEEKEVYQQIKNYHIERVDVEEDIAFLATEESKYWNNYVLTGKKPPLQLPSI